MTVVLIFFSILFGSLITVFVTKKYFKKLAQRLTQSMPSFFNASMQAENLRKLELWAKDLQGLDKKKILYIVDYFGITGGAETRVASQIKYLQSHGWECCLLSQYNMYSPLFSITNFHLNFSEHSLCEYLFEIVKKGNFDCVEFIFKDWNHIKKIDFDNLKTTCRVGCFVCNMTDLPDAYANKFDYRITFTNNTIKLPNAVCIRNWLRFTPENCWKFNNQKNALLISRIDLEKLPTIKNFIDICEKYAIAPMIAGPILDHSPKVRKQLSRIPPENLLSSINTMEFLKHNHNSILFIAGVGQVPLEAISFGYPALVVTHKKEVELSTFVTIDNLDFLYRWNFVIRKCPITSSLGNLDAFFESLNDQSLSKFVIPTEDLERFSIDTAMREYLTHIHSSFPTEITK